MLGIIFWFSNACLYSSHAYWDADISDYFGSIVRSQLMTMLQKGIADQHLLALIGKWLNAGVIEDGQLLLSENGTYQGSIISPVLASLYLREVLDSWFEKFGLKLHPEKTKLIEFGRTAWVKSKRTGVKPDTFNFLGLTSAALTVSPKRNWIVGRASAAAMCSGG